MATVTVNLTKRQMVRNVLTFYPHYTPAQVARYIHQVYNKSFISGWLYAYCKQEKLRKKRKSKTKAKE